MTTDQLLASVEADCKDGMPIDVSRAKRLIAEYRQLLQVRDLARELVAEMRRTNERHQREGGAWTFVACVAICCLAVIAGVAIGRWS